MWQRQSHMLVGESCTLVVLVVLLGWVRMMMMTMMIGEYWCRNRGPNPFWFVPLWCEDNHSPPSILLGHNVRVRGTPPSLVRSTNPRLCTWVPPNWSFQHASNPERTTTINLILSWTSTINLSFSWTIVVFGHLFVTRHWSSSLNPPSFWVLFTIPACKDQDRGLFFFRSLFAFATKLFGQKLPTVPPEQAKPTVGPESWFRTWINEYR